jgi:hypothetical protein
MVVLVHFQNQRTLSGKFTRNNNRNFFWGDKLQKQPFLQPFCFFLSLHQKKNKQMRSFVNLAQAKKFCEGIIKKREQIKS